MSGKATVSQRLKCMRIANNIVKPRVDESTGIWQGCRIPTSCIVKKYVHVLYRNNCTLSCCDSKTRKYSIIKPHKMSWLFSVVYKAMTHEIQEANDYVFGWEPRSGIVIF